MKMMRFALPFVFAATSLAAHASVEVINTDSSKASFSAKAFTTSAAWKYDQAFDLDLSFSFAGTGSINWTLTELGVGSETGSYSVLSTQGSTKSEQWLGLEAGSYQLSYNVSLAKGSTFSETLTSSIEPVVVVAAVPTPVPEPSSYAMLFSGLGAVVLIARRRIRY